MLSFYFQLVIFDYRIGKKIAAKPVQLFFKIGIVTFDIDLKMFSDPHAAHFGHAEMPHGITHSVSLGVEHGFLRLHDHVHFHRSILISLRAQQVAIVGRDITWNLLCESTLFIHFLPT